MIGKPQAIGGVFVLEETQAKTLGVLGQQGDRCDLTHILRRRAAVVGLREHETGVVEDGPSRLVFSVGLSRQAAHFATSCEFDGERECCLSESTTAMLGIDPKMYLRSIVHRLAQRDAADTSIGWWQRDRQHQRMPAFVAGGSTVYPDGRVIARP